MPSPARSRSTWSRMSGSACAKRTIESNFLRSCRSRHFSWYRYCLRPASSTPVAWMWPIGYGQIQTSCHAGGILSSPIRSSTSESEMRRPSSSRYSKPLPRRLRVRPGPVQSERFKRAMDCQSAPRCGGLNPCSDRFQPGLSSRCMPASLDGLDRAQRAAVTHRAGPLLILGGPGTGKTHVLAHRAGWLIEEGAPAASVLGLGPTAAPAADLRLRLETLIETPYDDLSVYGAQELCERLLRDEALEAGLDPLFAPVSAADRLALLLERIEDLPLRRHEI